MPLRFPPLLAIGLAVQALQAPQTIAAEPVVARLEQADSVVVDKSERRLDLMRNGQVLRSFRVALGLSPEGHKEREGDFRTPEGRYRLTSRNADSDFFLSIGISYPSAADTARARRNGDAPGGYIMIHGQPNEPRYSAEYYRRMDWTNGCIAVSNADMVDIWLMTRSDLPIEIVP
jgi:murein L,D-transpeptidase YafK